MQILVLKGQDLPISPVPAPLMEVRVATTRLLKEIGLNQHQLCPPELTLGHFQMKRAGICPENLLS